MAPSYLTLFRAVGWMSRGDLSTRAGHAGYNVATPDAQGLGTLRYQVALAVGPDAVRELAPGLIVPHATPLAAATPGDQPLLSVEPPSVRLSICKRAADGDGLVVRLIGAAADAVTARVRLFRPIRRARLSDLDERDGPELPIEGCGESLIVQIAANDIVTLRID